MRAARPVTRASLKSFYSMQVHCLFAFCKPMTANYRCPRGSHPCTMLSFTIGGSGVVRRDGSRLAYGPSSILVHPANEMYWIEQDAAGQHICIGMRGCNAESIKPGVHRVPAALKDTALQLRGLILNTKQWSQIRIELLAGLASITLFELHPAEESSGLAQRARKIIHSEYQRALSVHELAERLHFSVDHLRAKFHAAYGVSPKHYLHQYRLEAAKDLLRSSTIAVQEAARLCGFSDPFYFSRQFRLNTGYSPSHWRERHAPA
jgi:AraC-like DNA-binding protein